MICGRRQGWHSFWRKTYNLYSKYLFWCHMGLSIRFQRVYLALYRYHVTTLVLYMSLQIKSCNRYKTQKLRGQHIHTAWARIKWIDLILFNGRVLNSCVSCIFFRVYILIWCLILHNILQKLLNMIEWFLTSAGVSF